MLFTYCLGKTPDVDPDRVRIDELSLAAEVDRLNSNAELRDVLGSSRPTSLISHG